LPVSRRCRPATPPPLPLPISLSVPRSREKNARNARRHATRQSVKRRTRVRMRVKLRHARFARRGEGRLPRLRERRETEDEFFARSATFFCNAMREIAITRTGYSSRNRKDGFGIPRADIARGLPGERRKKREFTLARASSEGVAMQQRRNNPRSGLPFSPAVISKLKTMPRD